MNLHRLARLARVVSVFAALAVAPAALAGWFDDDRYDRHHRRPPPQQRHAVPEFDPAALGAITALIAGGGLLIASRRNRGTK